MEKNNSSGNFRGTDLATINCAGTLFTAPYSKRTTAVHFGNYTLFTERGGVGEPILCYSHDLV